MGNPDPPHMKCCSRTHITMATRVKAKATSTDKPNAVIEASNDEREPKPKSGSPKNIEGESFPLFIWIFMAWFRAHAYMMVITQKTQNQWKTLDKGGFLLYKIGGVQSVYHFFKHSIFISNPKVAQLTLNPENYSCRKHPPNYRATFLYFVGTSHSIQEDVERIGMVDHHEEDAHPDSQILQ